MAKLQKSFVHGGKVVYPQGKRRRLIVINIFQQLL